MCEWRCQSRAGGAAQPLTVGSVVTCTHFHHRTVLKFNTTAGRVMSRAFICLDLRPLHAVTHLVSWRSKTKMMLTSDYLIDTLFLQREASTPTLQATTANE